METAIQRSWPRTVAWSGLGLALGVGGGWLGWWATTGDGLRFLAWLPAIFFFILALTCFLAARALAGHAACPHCGESVLADGAETLRAVHCDACLEYARVVDGRLQRLPEDWVDAEARFTTTVPKDEISWPGCAMCGAPPTRTRVHDHLVTDTALNAVVGAIGMATVGLTVVSGGTLHEVSVPYCDEHDDCVELDWESGRLVIRFRSPRVREAFRSINRGEEQASRARSGSSEGPIVF